MRLVTEAHGHLPHFGAVEAPFRAAVQPGRLALASGPVDSGKTALALKTAIALREAMGALVYDLRGHGAPSAHERAALHAALLRSRHTGVPVIAIAELRERTTMEAVEELLDARAAVLATVHLRRPFDAPARLLGLAGEHLTRSVVSRLSACVGLRLLLKLCPHCRVPIPLSDTEGNADAEVTKPVPIGGAMIRPPYRRGQGCEACHGRGIAQRAPLAELLLPNGPMLDAVARGDTQSFVDIARSTEAEGTVFRSMHANLRTGLLAGDFDPAMVRSIANSLDAPA